MRIGCRVLRDRHRARVAVPTQVHETATGVAQDIVAPTGDARVAPTAPASAIGPQSHAVASIGQQVRGLDGRQAWCDIAQHAQSLALMLLRDGAGGWRVERRNLARHTFMQQRGHGLDMRIAHAPPPWGAVEQHIGQRHNAHALVVGHEGAHPGDPVHACLAGRREVQRLDQPIHAAPLHGLNAAQVGDGLMRHQLSRQHGGIGRNHQFILWRAPQGQSGHALWRVLVGQRVVAGGISRLRHAPGRVLLSRIGHLLQHRRVARAVQQTAMRLVQHQRGHQVLEHRTRPRAQPRMTSASVRGTAQGRPVAHGHIALGNGQQARQTGLRRQQVIEAGIQLLLSDAVTNVKEVALAVVQKAVVRLPGHAFETAGQGTQPDDDVGILAFSSLIPKCGSQGGDMVRQTSQKRFAPRAGLSHHLQSFDLAARRDHQRLPAIRR